MYNKALVALAAAVIGLLDTFGVSVPAGLQGIIDTFVPVIGVVLVYFIPNKVS